MLIWTLVGAQDLRSSQLNYSLWIGGSDEENQEPRRIARQLPYRIPNIGYRMPFVQYLMGHTIEHLIV